MDNKSFAIKVSVAQDALLTAADRIADKLGLVAEIEAVRANALTAKQPELSRLRQLEGLAALLSKVADQMDSVEAESDDGDEGVDKDAAPRSKFSKRK